MMKKDVIKDFWEHNPCGEHLVTDEPAQKDHFRDFFLQYDQFRYQTEGHILSNLDRIDVKGKKVLEIGLGQGADAQQLIERGAIYHGIDVTAEACERTKMRLKIFQKSYRDIQQASAANIPFEDANFDIIYSHGVLHHIPDIDQVIPELQRVLKPGGRLIVMLYARKSLNYRLSILILRRLLFLGLYVLDLITLRKLIQKPLLRKHLEHAAQEGLGCYLKKERFLSRNTDGPDNPYSRVYSPEEVKDIFQGFEFEKFEQFFLNERHFPLLKLLPESWRYKLSRHWGWHLWCYGHKKRNLT